LARSCDVGHVRRSAEARRRRGRFVAARVGGGYSWMGRVEGSENARSDESAEFEWSGHQLILPCRRLGRHVSPDPIYHKWKASLENRWFLMERPGLRLNELFGVVEENDTEEGTEGGVGMI
jgi:hypothetical protein